MQHSHDRLMEAADHGRCEVLHTLASTQKPQDLMILRQAMHIWAGLQMKQKFCHFASMQPSGTNVNEDRLATSRSTMSPPQKPLPKPFLRGCWICPAWQPLSAAMYADALWQFQLKLLIATCPSLLPPSSPQQHALLPSCSQ